MVANPAMAEEQVTLSPQAPLSAKEVAGSIAYLRSQYGITEAEALRRLELQRASAELNAKLAEMFPREYGGLWLDQEGGGLLDIAATDVGKIGDAIKGLPDVSHIVRQRVRWPLAELIETRDRLDVTLNSRADPKVRNVEIVADPKTNSVLVFQRENAEAAGKSLATVRDVEQAQNRLAAVPKREVVEAIDKENGRAVLKQLVVGPPKALQLPGSAPMDTPVSPGCDPRYCSPPMRGGMRLNVLRSQAAPTWPYSDYLNAWYGQCSNGFNMGDSRGWVYIMTAGHCTVGQYKIGVNYTYYTDWTPVSYEVFNFENGPTNSNQSTYPRDYSIQPFQVVGSTNYAHYWLVPYARSLVMSWCWWSSSTWQGCADGSFYIHGYYSYSQIMNGWIVCSTGSGDSSSDSGYHSNIGYSPGTRCGQISGHNGGLLTNICTRHGDSGGPLFSEIDGRAYGILHGGTAASGACPTNPPGTEYSDYSPISEILAHVRAQTLRLEGRDYGFYLLTG